MGIFSVKRKKYATLTVKHDGKIEHEIPKKDDGDLLEDGSIELQIPLEVAIKPPEVQKEVVDKDALWLKCPSCNEIVYKVDIDNMLKKCPICDYYFKMTARERISLLTDDGTFEEKDGELKSANPLDFPKYTEKYNETVEKTGLNDGVVSGVGNINGLQISIAAMDFDFMGGSMGSVVGEKITRAVERGYDLEIPVVVVAASGGARMHEGILSLMQMAKTSAAIERLKKKGIPYVVIPTDPTTGGVTASFAMLGDIILTEPKALIAFAGPRVIEQTIKQKLPEGFQRSEFLQEHGMVDVIAKREDLKETLYKFLSCAVLGRVK